MIARFVPILPSLALMAWLLTPVAAESHIGVSGRITNGTPGGEMPADLQVVLTVFDGDAISQELSSTTDEEGVFSFEEVPADPGLRYLVTIEYQGAIYPAETHLDNDTPLNLTIYESTTEQGALEVLDDIMMVSRGDQEFGVLLIREVARIQNSRQLTFVPSFGQEGMSSMTFLRFSLPFGYEDLTVRSDLLGGQVIPVDRGVGITTPVPPGIHAIVLSYTIPYEGTNLVFEPSFPFGAQVLQILFRDDVGTVLGSELEQIEPISVGEQTFRVFQASEIASGDRITVGFTDLPQAPWNQRAWDSIKSQWELSLVIPGLAAIFLLGLLIYAWTLRRKRLDPVALTSLIDNIQRQPDQHQCLEAIAKLDERYEHNAITEEEYRAQRQDLKRTLLNLAVKQARYL